MPAAWLKLIAVIEGGERENGNVFFLCMHAAGSFCTDARIYMQARKAKSNEQMKERERGGKSRQIRLNLKWDIN